MTASASSTITTHALPPERRMPAGRHAIGIRQSRINTAPIGTRRDTVPNRRVMDLEDAFTWAYHEDLPKRREGNGELGLLTHLPSRFDKHAVMA